MEDINLCSRLDPAGSVSMNDSTLLGLGGINFTVDSPWNESSPVEYNATQPTFIFGVDNIRYIMNGIITPMFCIFGIIGNAFNILVLTRPRMSVAMDNTLEKSAQTGLLSLAVSDMLYCVCKMVHAYPGRPNVLFKGGEEGWLYVQLYGVYVINIFVNTSTWLTVVMAAARYAAICRPLHARYMLGVTPTRLVVVGTLVVWVVLQLPEAWSFQTTVQSCTSQVYYIVHEGQFMQNKTLKAAFTYIWACVGFIVPVAVLAFCNVHLIRALQASRRMRRLYVYRISAKTVNYSNRATPTLIAIILMFLVLVTPSQVLHFLQYHINDVNTEVFTILLLITNTMNTINFSLNFVMYCIVNTQFRQTLTNIVFCAVRRHSYYRQRKRLSSRASTNSTKGSMMIYSNLESLVSAASVPSSASKTRLSELTVQTRLSQP